MTYKQFVSWCNARACDGCWGMLTAMYCIAAVEEINSKPFWKREKAWKASNRENDIVNRIIIPINRKMEELGVQPQSKGQAKRFSIQTGQPVEYGGVVYVDGIAQEKGGEQHEKRTTG